ncbi:L,D-transpeptidase family protein [Sphingomonas humi]|uniref:L,D-TPase catalytic domain-containing protein n=1 Tax=Sphingomonas humi TaxID=335630 RepID=A0ABP7RQA3_9SPHN
MRWLTLVGVAAVVGGFLSYLAVPRSDAAVSAAAAPAVQSRSSADDKRIYLSPDQRREATGKAGFAIAPRSLLRVDRRLQYGEYEWNAEGVPPGPVTVRVDLRTQLMSVFRGGHEIGTTVALYGADSKETPLGRFPILWKGKNHRSSLYDAPMPYTLRLTGDGVAIHGSNVRWGAATHGCVGVPTGFAEKLFAATKIGDVVTIVRTKNGTAS